MIYGSGIVYNGSWKSDYKFGLGKMNLPTGETYEGEWILDYKEGSFKITLNDGTVIGKNCFNDNFIEINEFIYPNGDVFTGKHAGEYILGPTGIMKYKSGDIYNGQWSRNMKHGQGKMVY